MESIFTGLDLPEEVKTTLQERIEKEKSEWVEGAKNDPDFIGSIRSEEAGKFFKSQERIYRKVFPDLNLDDIDGSGLKRMEQIALAGVATLEKTKDATNQELQDKYLKVSQEYNAFKEEHVPKILEEQKSKFHKSFIKDGILKDSLEFDTTCEPDFRVSAVEVYLGKNGWEPRWDEDKGKYVFRTREGNLIPTRDDKPLSEKQIIQEAFKAAGVLKQSNGGNPNTPPQGPQGGHTSAGKLSPAAQRMLETTRKEGSAAV